MQVKITLEDLENYCNGNSETVEKILRNMNEYSLNNYIYENDLKISDMVRITKFNDYENYEIELNFNVEDQILLTMITDLDARYYDATTVLYNEIVKKENDRKFINQTTVFSEMLDFLLFRIENELEYSIQDISINPLTQISIDFYLDKLDNEFKKIIDLNLLKEKIEFGINELFDIINSQIMNYFENELLELENSIEDSNLMFLWEEININGHYEDFI